MNSVALASPQVSNLRNQDHLILVDEIRAQWPKDDHPEFIRLASTDMPPQTVAERVGVENDTPESVAGWLEVMAHRDTRENGYDRPVRYLGIIFDPALPVTVYGYPEPHKMEPAVALATALTDQAIRHTERKDELMIDMFKVHTKAVEQTIGGQSSALKAALEENASLRARNAKLEEELYTLRKLHIELMDHKHVRDLEVREAEQKEKIKEATASRVLGLVDKAVDIGGAAVLSKLEEKMGPPLLDKLANLLSDDDKELLGELVARAQTRASEINNSKESE